MQRGRPVSAVGKRGWTAVGIAAVLFAVGAIAAVGVAASSIFSSGVFECPSDAWVDEAKAAAAELVPEGASNTGSGVSDCDDDHMVSFWFDHPTDADTSYAEIVDHAKQHGWTQPTRGSCHQKSIQGLTTEIEITISKADGAIQVYPGSCPTDEATETDNPDAGYNRAFAAIRDSSLPITAVSLNDQAPGIIVVAEANSGLKVEQVAAITGLPANQIVLKFEEATPRPTGAPLVPTRNVVEPRD